ncbi:MAG: SOS response-associated peptidase [Acidimicrobiales bacterium]
MCGRFVSSSPPDEIARYFDAEPPAEAALEPNWNVAPTSDVYVVLVDGGVRRLATHHWGLVPFWAKSPAVGNKMINARAEGLADKGAFKHAFRKRRCILPADGFYEWQKRPGQKAKQPYFVHRVDDEPLAFAGLWEEWRAPDAEGGGRLRSATIITTEANETMAAIHDRMPVVLPPSAWDAWLDPDDADLDVLGRLLVPAPPRILTMHPVGAEVGNVRNTGPRLVDAVEPAAPTLALDERAGRPADP